MEPILTIDNLNSFGGNMLRQGDKSQLKYRLRDVGNKNLGISGKSCEVTMYGRNYTTVVYETTTTVSSDNTVSFTIDKILPKGTFYLEFTVGDYIFPTDHREFFEITPSGKGVDANVIEIVGKDVIIREVKEQIDGELEPFLGEIEQAELDRQVQEEARETAEGKREETHEKIKDLPDAFQIVKDDFNQHKLDYTAQFNEGFPSQAKDLMDNRTYTIKLQLSSEGNPQLISKEVL